MRCTVERFFAIGCALALGACANINSINRDTSLPGSNAVTGKAVHLDAQQRVVLVNEFGEFCAEPSPDALAAYAASLALSASVPSSGAGSLAGGQQSSAASIGLRTQSITLMRDALYRMCEAYANGAVGPAQVASLLGRSQDLTAVILAVEQLTGAVTANQVALTGTTSASASASLLSNQNLLDSARENEANKTAKLAEAEAALETRKKERNIQEGKVAAATAERDRLIAPNSGASDSQKAEAQAKLDRETQELQRAQREVDAAEQLVATRKTLLEEARRNRETVQNSKDSALTDAAASTTSSSQFSTPLARKELDKAATEAIAKAVDHMVVTVLNKQYTEESCMAMLTYIPPDYGDWKPAQQEVLKRVQALCAQVVEQSLARQIERITFGVDEATQRIEAWLDAAPENRQLLRDWIAEKELGIDIPYLLRGAEYAVDRLLAISDLKIP